MIPSVFDYLPEHAEQLLKRAEKQPDSPYSRKAKIMGKGLLSFGGGYALGIGTSALADKLHERATGIKIPRSTLMHAAPLITGAMGMAYGVHKALEQEELNRASED